MEHAETFWTLLRDPAHWCFELFLMGLFDGVIGLLVWPWFSRALLHHQSDDRKIDALEQQVKELRKRLGIEA